MKYSELFVIAKIGCNHKGTIEIVKEFIKTATIYCKAAYYTFFEDVETTKEYDCYFYEVTDAIVIVLRGSICGLKNISKIHQWASSDRIKEFLKEKFQIKVVLCYY